MVWMLAWQATGCRTQGRPGNGDVPPPAAHDAARDIFPSAGFLSHLGRDFSLESKTRIDVEHGSTTVVIQDHKTAAVKGSGDFDVRFERRHEGSSAGDTLETIRAVRVDGRYFTKGSGGPFVAWDDAMDEPEQVLAEALSQTYGLLSFLGPCLAADRKDDSWILSVSGKGCHAAAPGKGAAMDAEVVSLDGEARWKDGLPVAIELRVVMKVSAGRRSSVTRIEHHASVNVAPVFIEAPAEWIDSRRFRPVKMLRDVLEGLVDGWGPGAPKALKDDEFRPGPVRGGKVD